MNDSGLSAGTLAKVVEQEFRTDFLHQYNTKGFTIWNYDNGKGLELIPEHHTEILINLPPFFDRSNGQKDGFGDISFLAKGRIFARNEQKGNAIITAFFGGTIPTGKNGNGSCCAVVTPRPAPRALLRADLNCRWFAACHHLTGLGHIITWNSVAQYRLAKTGVARLFWPEVEANCQLLQRRSQRRQGSHLPHAGTADRPYSRRHTPPRETRGPGLTFGAGQQIAVTHFHTYNHSTVITVRIPF